MLMLVAYVEEEKKVRATLSAVIAGTYRTLHLDEEEVDVVM